MHAKTNGILYVELGTIGFKENTLKRTKSFKIFVKENRYK